MPGIGIVTNPHSRRNRRFPERMRRLGYILGRNDVYEMTSQLRDVARVAEEFRKNEIDILALNGGDGTNHVTLTHFIEVYKDQPLPKIALLRGGTMNTISEAVGAQGTPGKILLNLVEKYYTQQPFDITERGMLKISDDQGTRYGFIFANGVAANFLEMYYATGHPSPSVAVSVLAQMVGSALVGGPLVRRMSRPFDAEIEFPDEVWERRDYLAVLASSIEQVGLGFRVLPRCEERPGAFHLAGLHGSIMDVAATLPGLRLGKRPSEKVYRDAVTSSAIFRSEGEILYTIDGDMHRAQNEVHVESGPRLEIILG